MEKARYWRQCSRHCPCATGAVSEACVYEGVCPTRPTGSYRNYLHLRFTRGLPGRPAHDINHGECPQTHEPKLTRKHSSKLLLAATTIVLNRHVSHIRKYSKFVVSIAAVGKYRSLNIYIVNNIYRRGKVGKGSLTTAPTAPAPTNPRLVTGPLQCVLRCSVLLTALKPEWWKRCNRKPSPRQVCKDYGIYTTRTLRAPSVSLPLLPIPITLHVEYTSTKSQSHHFP